MTESRVPSPESRNPVIAIDGPGGSGKGTLSRLLAQRLGFGLLDSGALYRLVALAARERDISLHAQDELAALAEVLDAGFECGAQGEPAVSLGGRDVSRDIRAEDIGAAASTLAAYPLVRDALLLRQRAFRQPPGLVADGRDMGTRVFPDAELKIFLTAGLETRARRRHKQLKGQGINANLDTLFDELARRDARDAGRAAAPLEIAADAVVLDTTDLGIDAVLAEALRLARHRVS